MNMNETSELFRTECPNNKIFIYFAKGRHISGHLFAFFLGQPKRSSPLKEIICFTRSELLRLIVDLFYRPGPRTTIIP